MSLYPLDPVVLPDAEVLLIRYLGTRPELAGATVAAALPADIQITDRWVTVALLPAGPSSVDVWLDGPRFQVDSWAPTRAEASQLARMVRALLHVCRNVTYADGIISGTRLVQRPAWIPDSSRTPPTPRYSLTVDLFTHPVPQ